MKIKKILSSLYAAYFSWGIILILTAYLLIRFRLVDGVLFIGLALIVGILGDCVKKDLLRYLPLYGYGLLVDYRAICTAMADDFLRGEEVEEMVIVVKYCSVLLLTAPIFYYNKYLRNRFKE